MAVPIQIKGVPEDVRDALAARAAERGQSTQAYLRSILDREVRVARNRELLEQTSTHRGLAMTIDDVVADIRQGRDRAE